MVRKRRLSNLILPAILLLSFTPLSSLSAQQPDRHGCGTIPGFIANAGGESADPDETEKTDWDVSKPFGPTFDYQERVSEGTWMSCDVSPDGSQIAFDLLGDIYIMNIDGGEAKALTQGPAWDIQPSFSPDGQTIVFTSDRSGGDTIWTMDLSGENAHHLPDESFHLLPTPVFPPSGTSLLALPPFVPPRSFAAVSLFLSPLSFLLPRPPPDHTPYPCPPSLHLTSPP